MSSTELPHSQNLAFVETIYEEYCRDPSSITAGWREYFDSLGQQVRGAAGFARRPSFQPPGLFSSDNGSAKRRSRTVAGIAGKGPAVAELPEADRAVADFQERVGRLVRSYRVRGHMLAAVDPLQLNRSAQPELDPEFYGFTEADLERPIAPNTVAFPEASTLGELIDCLRQTYCRSIGVQFMHIHDLSVRWWLRDHMESVGNRIQLKREEQLRILARLTDAVVFESFLARKYPAAKSFSLSGAESLIPLLDLTIEKAGEHGVKEIVLAMAHRGRLNVLSNILGKRPKDIFREFDDVDPERYIGGGDVKYHLGYSSDWTTALGHSVHLSLCFNPSHLEFVNPVALGRVRAKQDRVGDAERVSSMALLIHGDAAFAGEGVVQETFNLSQLDGYSTGGSIHVVVNNQIGFTTPPSQSTSGVYATAVARMLQIPIFHVNGEDPEAVAQVVQLAMEFRREFHRDVVIDMYCYRRFGHNEADEPAFTQPLLYRAIRERKPVRRGYLEHLLRLGGVTAEEVEQLASERRRQLDSDLELARGEEYTHESAPPTGVWAGYHGGSEEAAEDVGTTIPAPTAVSLLRQLGTVPKDFKPHRKLERWLDARRAMARRERPLDWAAAEALALGSLAAQGHRVRLTGQDCERGTFSQRHAVLHDVEDGHRYVPLEHLTPDQGPVEIHNSPLSEAGVLGFEYGYSLDCPEALILWEAQFGDFVNTAQVIIDQFIVSAEDKWNRLSGLVLLLPHGFEGMGPEHSSARLERFLSLAAEDNIQVVYPTTPAQYFHLLRRQVRRPWRKPLVVFTPKSLLRRQEAVSPLEECAEGRFRRVIPDLRHSPEQVERILLCSGKVFFDLQQKRLDAKRTDVALIRLEQLYPFPDDSLKRTLATYPEGTLLVWVQEEPENMGAWTYVRYLLGQRAFGRFPLHGVYREASASPATGSANTHHIEQEAILWQAFDADVDSLSARAVR
jgi:2-oxoglutarate dehydrogenase E1 component